MPCLQGSQLISSLVCLSTAWKFFLSYLWRSLFTYLCSSLYIRKEIAGSYSNIISRSQQLFRVSSSFKAIFQSYSCLFCALTSNLMSIIFLYSKVSYSVQLQAWGPSFRQRCSDYIWVSFFWGWLCPTLPIKEQNLTLLSLALIPLCNVTLSIYFYNYFCSSSS